MPARGGKRSKLSIFDDGPTNTGSKGNAMLIALHDLGEWRLTKAAGVDLQQGQVVSITYTESAVVVSVNGREVGSAGYDLTTFENWGDGRGMLALAGRQMEIESMSSVTPLRLQETIYVLRSGGQPTGPESVRGFHDFESPTLAGEAQRAMGSRGSREGSNLKLGLAIIGVPAVIGYEMWAISLLRPDGNDLLGFDAVWLVFAPFLVVSAYWRSKRKH